MLSSPVTSERRRGIAAVPFKGLTCLGRAQCRSSRLGRVRPGPQEPRPTSPTRGDPAPRRGGREPRLTREPPVRLAAPSRSRAEETRFLVPGTDPIRGCVRSEALGRRLLPRHPGVASRSWARCRITKGRDPSRWTCTLGGSYGFGEPSLESPAFNSSGLALRHRLHQRNGEQTRVRGESRPAARKSSTKTKRGQNRCDPPRA